MLVVFVAATATISPALGAVLNLETACGLDFVLVLDRSGSVADSEDQEAVRDGGKTGFPELRLRGDVLGTEDGLAKR
ncbi:MAG: hypothetical protein ACRDV9_13550, partial [Acidimicrobiia bacterium]